MWLFTPIISSQSTVFDRFKDQHLITLEDEKYVEACKGR